MRKVAALSKFVAKTSPGLHVPTRKIKAAPVWHAHGCTNCGRRYTDVCLTADVDEKCMPCRTGGLHAPTQEDRNREPQECCFEGCVLIKDSDDLNRYKLAGGKPWWRCRACSRTHPGVRPPERKPQ